MTFLAAGKVNYHARIERAALLARRHEFAREILSFYGFIATFQREFHESLPKLWEETRGSRKRRFALGIAPEFAPGVIRKIPQNPRGASPRRHGRGVAEAAGERLRAAGRAFAGILEDWLAGASAAG